jgi:hypothetical protein
MEETAELWQRVRGSKAVPTFGLRFEWDSEPARVEATGMIESFRVGCQNLQEVWGMVLPPADLLEVRRAGRASTDTFNLGDELWARTVYDFAVAHRLGIIGREHLLGAMTPLYKGWAGSFLLGVKDSTPAQVEERIERLALAFEQQKPYLISRWRWPDRFRP